VRENQQKSRARKQQYTQELEQKVAACRTQAHQKDIEHRISIQELKTENAKLRHWLLSLGVQASRIDEYLHENSDPAVSKKVAIPKQLPDLSGDTALQESSSPCTSSSSTHLSNCRVRRNSGNAVNSITSSMEPSCSSPTLTNGLSGHKTVDHILTHSATPISYEFLCDNSSCAPWPENENILNTTLCTVAAELINQFNVHGVELTEIKTKLWSGFRKGSSVAEPCRVQNQVLFEVLDEVSANLS
jgi:hypothetical protein